VHASDAYMNAVARPLVAGHVALGGHALLMSATLGSGQRAALLGQCTPTRQAAEAVPYPAIWHDAAPSTPLRHAPDDRRKTVHPVLVPTMNPAEATRPAVAAAGHRAISSLYRARATSVPLMSHSPQALSGEVRFSRVGGAEGAWHSPLAQLGVTIDPHQDSFCHAHYSGSDPEEEKRWT
jgi:CRISPR-associated endonuclease/helicase Cas3